MAILLLAEHDNNHLSDQTAKALTAAARSAAMFTSSSPARRQGAADAAAKLSGVEKVLLAER
jgi:electron transfer flavoprotein alpha subunit